MSGTLQIQEIEVVIAAGQSILAAALAADGRTPVYIDTPAGFEGTAIGFSTGDGLRTLRGVYGQEMVLTLGAAGSRHCLLEGGVGWTLMRMGSWRIYAGTGFAARQVQAASRSLVVGLSVI